MKISVVCKAVEGLSHRKVIAIIGVGRAVTRTAFDKE